MVMWNIFINVTIPYRCLDNTSELVLDSATVVTGPDHDRRDSMGTTSRLIGIKDVRGRKATTVKSEHCNTFTYGH